jgi:hypothetical protein
MQEEKIRPNKSSLGKEQNEEYKRRSRKEKKKQTEIFMLFFNSINFYL